MKTNTGQTGTVVLTNTKPYPFNDSLTTVALSASQDGCGYAVLTEVTESAGEVGDIAQAREVIRGSFPVQEYEPRNTAAWDAAYDRFTHSARGGE